MKLITRIREWWALQDATVTARIISTWQANRPLPAPNDYTAFGEEGARRNSLIASCVWEIATSASEPALVVEQVRKDGARVLAPYDSQLAQLLRKPNGYQDQFSFLEMLNTHQQITGNCYIWKIRPLRGGRPVALIPLRPDRVTIIPGADGNAAFYDFSLGGAGKARRIDGRDVIHCPLHPDPLDDYYGLGPIAVLQRFIDLDNSAIDYLRAFFLNGGAPMGFLKTKAKTERADRERAAAQWQENYGGLKGWHKVGVLDVDVEYQALGTNPNRLGMEEQWNLIESRITGAFGVPAIIVGTNVGLARSTYANYLEARKSFWGETLGPIYRRFGSAFTSGIAREFGDDLEIRFDLSTVQALQEDQQVKRTFALGAWGGGLATRNEARQMAGFTPVDGAAGDVFFGESASAVIDGEIVPEPGLPTAGAGSVADTALNGAQIDSLRSVLASVAKGEIPRASGVAILVTAFRLSLAEAEGVMGEIGKGFQVALPLDGLFSRFVTEQHALSADQRKTQKQLKRLMAAHFAKQGPALVAHIREGIE